MTRVPNAKRILEKEQDWHQRCLSMSKYVWVCTLFTIVHNSWEFLKILQSARLEWRILNFSELSCNKPFNLCLLKHPPELCLRKECCRNAAGLRHQSNASKIHDNHVRISRHLETGQKQITYVDERYWTNMDKQSQNFSNTFIPLECPCRIQVGLRMPLGTSQHLLSPAQFKLRVLLYSQSF